MFNPRKHLLPAALLVLAPMGLQAQVQVKLDRPILGPGQTANIFVRLADAPGNAHWQFGSDEVTFTQWEWACDPLPAGVTFTHTEDGSAEVVAPAALAEDLELVIQVHPLGQHEAATSIRIALVREAKRETKGEANAETKAETKEESKDAPIGHLELRGRSGPVWHEAAPIAAFTPRAQEAPGLKPVAGYPFAKALARHGSREVRAGSRLTLGAPALNGSCAAVACTVGDHENLLCTFDLKASAGQDPCVTALARLAHPVSQVRWLGSNALLAADRTGGVTLLHYKDGEPALKPCASFLGLHTEAIRDVVVHPDNPAEICTVSDDRRLMKMDLTRPGEVISAVELGGTISSAQWPVYNQGALVSCTTDNGRYLIFDSRAPFQQPVFDSNLGRPDLFAHRRYSDHHVLFGFGDGEIQHVDMRVTTGIPGRTRDPYVQAIDAFDHQWQDDRFLVTGGNDFSLWKRDSSGAASLLGHSLRGTAQRVSTEPLVTHGAFTDDNQLLVTTSKGQLVLYSLDPPKESKR